MSELKLYGMKAADDEIISTAIKRQHEPQRIVGDLLTAEITESSLRRLGLARGDTVAAIWKAAATRVVST